MDVRMGSRLSVDLAGTAAGGPILGLGRGNIGLILAASQHIVGIMGSQNGFGFGTFMRLNAGMMDGTKAAAAEAARALVTILAIKSLRAGGSG